MSWTAPSRFRALLSSEKRDVDLLSRWARMDATASTWQWAGRPAQAQCDGCVHSAVRDAESLQLAMLDWFARHHNDVTIGHTRGDMGQ
eukprot:5734612-Prymnesium_polylepis.1